MATKMRRRLPSGERWNEAAWETARKRVISISDPVCALCQGFVDLKAKPFTPQAPEVDHIVPIARGGQPYDIDNLQLTCHRCNRRKGTRMQSDYDGMETEQNMCPLSNNW